MVRFALGGKGVGTAAQGPQGTEVAVGKLLGEGHVKTRTGVGAPRTQGRPTDAAAGRGRSLAAPEGLGCWNVLAHAKPYRSLREKETSVTPILSLFKILIFCYYFLH